MVTVLNRPNSNANVEFDKEVARQNNAPRPFVPIWFKAELNAIGGKDAVTGKPNYRLVWGQSQDAKKMYVEDGVVVWRAKYPKAFFTQLIKLDIPRQQVSPVIERIEAISHDCYFIERYVPARRIPRDVWEDEWRWYCDPEDPLKLVDVMGPFPEEGMYVEYLCLRDGVTQEPVPPCQAVLNDLRARLAWEKEIDKLTPSEQVQRIVNEKRAQEMKMDLLHVQQLRDVLTYYHNGAIGNKTIGVLTDHAQPLLTTSKG